MKHMRLVFISIAIISLICISESRINAQQEQAGTYFIGGWDINPYDLPMGNFPFIINIDNIQDTLRISLYDEARTVFVEIDKIIHVTDSTMTFSFYDYENNIDVIFKFFKEDQDSISGSILDMYSLIGTRKKD